MHLLARPVSNFAAQGPEELAGPSVMESQKIHTDVFLKVVLTRAQGISPAWYHIAWGEVGNSLWGAGSILHEIKM